MILDSRRDIWIRPQAAIRGLPVAHHRRPSRTRGHWMSESRFRTCSSRSRGHAQWRWSAHGSCPRRRILFCQPRPPKSQVMVALLTLSKTPLASLSFRQIHLPASPPASQPLTFLESVEAGHSAHKIQARIGELLDITRPSLRMDSQAKYTCLARGEGGV